MKNIALIAALLLTLIPSVQAQPARGRDKAFAVPSGAGEGGSDSQAVWSLPVASFRDGTTTAVNPADGKILVRGVCATTTASTSEEVAIYDTDRITNLTIAKNVGDLLLLFKVKSTAVGSIDTAKASCEWFPRGLPTVYGLAWLTSSSSVRATVYYDKIAE